MGLVTRMPRQRAEPELLRMVEALRHEPFYGPGTWIDETLGVYVGWSARKSSFGDGMPLRNERHDVVLVFSGVEFPEPGTAARLRARGHRLDGAAPSYLVHLYEDDRAFPARTLGEVVVIQVGPSLSVGLIDRITEEMGIGDLVMMRKQ